MSDNPEKTIEWIAHPEGVSEVYANFLNLNWTLYDVRFRFGQVLPEESSQGMNWKILEDTSVTIPWGQAITLRDMLNEAISRYEVANGPFTQPKLP